MTDSPLHVGIDATCWTNDRGFGRFTRELVKALARRPSPNRYTLVFDEAPSTPVPEGVGIMVAGAGRTLRAQSAGKAARAPDYLFRLGAMASRARFDLFFFPAVYSYFPLLARTPCVVCYHDTIAERFPDLIFPSKLNFRLWQAKTALAKLQSRRAMTVSEASARELETVLKIPRDRIDVITEGPNPAFKVLDDPAAAAAARDRFGVPGGSPLLVYVGGFNRHKNVAGLLRAMPAVVAAHPGVRLMVVGDTSGQGFWDNLNELRGLVAAQPALEAAVQFPGYLDDDTVVALLNGADALVLPSLAEGFGLPAVEALACGTPVLASDRGSLPEVVGDAGLFFDPEDPADIASKINGFLADPIMREALAAKARAQAGLFTWDRAAELAEQSFRRCVAR